MTDRETEAVVLNAELRELKIREAEIRARLSSLAESEGAFSALPAVGTMVRVSSLECARLGQVGRVEAVKPGDYLPIKVAFADGVVGFRSFELEFGRAR